MALSPNSAITPQKVKSNVVTILTAVVNPNGDTPTNVVALVTPIGFDGARLVKVTAVPRDTTVATRIGLFKSQDNGTTKKLFATKDVAAYTQSTTTGPTSTQVADFGYSDAAPGFLGGNGTTVSEVIYVGVFVTQTGGGFDVYAEWAEY